MKPLRVGVYDSSTPSRQGGGASIRSCVIQQLKDASDEQVQFIRIGWTFHPEFPPAAQMVLRLPLWIRAWLSLSRLRWLLRPRAVLAQLRSNKLKGAKGAPNSDVLRRYERHVETSLHAMEIDLLLFLEDREAFGSRIPYITYVWEISRRIQPYFPETYSRAIWEEYEQAMGPILHRAFRIICGTETGRRQVLHSYGVPESRVKVIPFPVPFFGNSMSTPSRDPNPVRPVLTGSNPVSYFLYPANFWPHKNHVVILEALALLAARGISARVVFTGADHGNLDYVRARADQLGIAEQVVFSGFVTREELAALYKGAAALVFASLIGPDNLPPLEAMALGCQVIASDIEGSYDQLGEAALYFDPFSARDLAEKMSTILEASSPDLSRCAAAAQLVEACQPHRHMERVKSACLEFAPYARLTDWHTHNCV